jgi:2-polyprenyl-6-methoxyphenol hydroxylase-like FAD-dependent oxidoreductase
MNVVVVGAGPVGMFCGMSLARCGHVVTVIDRDPPPPVDGVWRRKNVMQFQHPHFFRPIVCQVLLEYVPEVWESAVAAGGLPVHNDGFPDEVRALECRRSTFERAMWCVAASEPGLTLRTGSAQRVLMDADRVSGVLVEGALVDADVVIIAAGRATHLGDEYRAPFEGGPCGFAYTTRMYRARPGMEAPSSPRPMFARYRGYEAAVFPQDDGTFSTLIARPAADGALGILRHTECWDAAVRQIPQLTSWTEPERFQPITEVMAGGLLTNTYRSQFDAEGNPGLAGLFFVGDAVSTTNPARGRGISLGLQQAAALVSMLEHDPYDHRGVARHFEAWCFDHIRPWFADHVRCDAKLLSRFAGNDVNLEDRIPSDVICDALQADASLRPFVAPYLGMQAPPESLRAIEERVRDLLRSGWRPQFASGPSRDELVEGIETLAAR